MEEIPIMLQSKHICALVLQITIGTLIVLPVFLETSIEIDHKSIHYLPIYTHYPSY